MTSFNQRQRPGRATRAPTRRLLPSSSGWRFWRRGRDSADDREDKSVNGHHKWRRRRLALAAQAVSYLGTLLLAALIIQAFLVVVLGKVWTYAPLDERCQVNSVSCGILSGITVPLLSIAFASTTFLFFRLARLRKRYRRKARKNPRKLVPTAGSILERVVGRDELCYVIMDNLADLQTRQAFIIVGGVGAGKTAVLVQLTKLLADAKAIPVPIMLREAQSEAELDFRKMANNRFSADVATSLEGESKRAWNQLRRDDRIVVLADGLEEALLDNDQRNNVIRLAIERANAQKLPLVIASRPHDPLRNMAAAIIELEPLSEEAALTYMQKDISPGRGAERLDWIVETAEVAEEPLYLQITRDLYKNGLLEQASPRPGAPALDTRDADRTSLRLQLLDAWANALEHGYFPEGLVMSQQDRLVALNVASALACIGLKQDSVDVKFADLLGPPPKNPTGSPDGAIGRAGTPKQSGLHRNPGSTEVKNSRGQRKVELRPLTRKVPHPLLTGFMQEQLGGLKPDIQVAAAWGEQLGLVEMHGESVRFPHSLVEAYLGSRMMSAALRDDRYCREAAQKPGREFLIAVVMYFCSNRALEAAARCQKNEIKNGWPVTSWGEDVSFILDLLMESARVQEVAAKKLDIYAAALEIDSANGGRQHADIAREARKTWPPTTMTYDRALEEAKLGLVHRFGEAVRKVAKLTQLENHAAAAAVPRIAAYVPADEKISEDARAIWPPASTIYDRPYEEARHGKRRFTHAVHMAAKVTQPENQAVTAPVRHVPAFVELYQIGIKETSYPVRLAVALEIGAGGDQAFACLRGKFSQVQSRVDEPLEQRARLSDDQAQQRWREEVLCAWLAPLLAGSVSSQPGDQAKNISGTEAERGSQPLPDKRGKDKKKTGADPSPESVLNGWMRRLGKDSARSGNVLLPISLEIALAQGFKYAANRQRYYPGAHPETRAWLADQAMEMLKRSRFWFTHLTLLHALCLWSLRDDESAERVPGGHGSQPEAIVRQWLTVAGSEATDGNRPAGGAHPFVAAAGNLVVLALQEQRPEKYIWIDESGVTGIVGSHAEGVGTRRKHSLWIPPSTGWSVLDPRARRLVADVLVLLNLAERGDRPEDHDRRLGFTDRPNLPPCITEDRSFLNPAQPVGPGGSGPPGSNCRDDCPFRLCPYPPFGGPSYRVELSEPFCRNQASTSKGPGRAGAPWQQMRAAALRKSWGLMAERSRSTPRPEDADD
jgi:NACHT domain